MQNPPAKQCKKHVTKTKICSPRSQTNESPGFSQVSLSTPAAEAHSQKKKEQKDKKAPKKARLSSKNRFPPAPSHLGILPSKSPTQEDPKHRNSLPPPSHPSTCKSSPNHAQLARSQPRAAGGDGWTGMPSLGSPIAMEWKSPMQFKVATSTLSLNPHTPLISSHCSHRHHHHCRCCCPGSLSCPNPHHYYRRHSCPPPRRRSSRGKTARCAGRRRPRAC